MVRRTYLIFFGAVALTAAVILAAALASWFPPVAALMTKLPKDWVVIASALCTGLLLGTAPSLLTFAASQPSATDAPGSAPSPGLPPAPFFNADYMLLAGLGLVIGAFLIAAVTGRATGPQAIVACSLACTAFWSFLSLFRNVQEGRRVEFRSHWGGLGGGLGGFEISSSAVLLIVFAVAALSTAVIVRPAPAPVAHEQPRGLTPIMLE